MFGIFGRRKKMFKVNYVVGMSVTDEHFSFKREWLEYKHVEAYDVYDALSIFTREMINFVGNMFIRNVEEINPLKERKQ